MGAKNLRYLTFISILKYNKIQHGSIKFDPNTNIILTHEYKYAAFMRHNLFGQKIQVR